MNERDVLYLEHIVEDLQPLAETASKLLREARP